ncbi:ElaB/YqjD/DUF883 family membrane-anchored ribosome-binding protein [Clostridium acetobutylicum]|uniref:LXG domain-containing protein n=1 Tax=Clostridium acetobutylicum (strain ATCC 824 / DSM 792 / JCM 1419 / IAM 19013 / LMG 5710 / NBRC 13948 / NRRL B-527 / VKM B-1787 / 2291 / W) TaxID=272562 RepID=Q97HH2_CLOAB|nr:MULTISPECIES: hypothetical protein [Clostridium]AAK79998.1 Hypothetical protein, CF-5 family [Clostridium acetobutylicum ATCC 824]ADZ21090.1 conserved hypothetical protein [Clostridium acetobutylicum EA 2018]AEI32146.1 hypothetical protein SMB_G2071 [Clostridium acetobutylicum DSM 1731]AWV79572.1 hypothetical protein DK921_05550 [Clostridium acetobutylicum]MBC2394454.1 hypothetical protein [Clostridium acetobutylicum]
MADKIKMEYMIMDSMTFEFRTMGGNLDNIIKDLNKILVSLELSYISAASLIICQNITDSLKLGKQITNNIYKLSIKLNDAKATIANSDKALAASMGLASGAVLYRGNDDENLDKVLKEADKTTKEVDGFLKEFDKEEEMEKKAWYNKPAKEDIFDKIEYFVTGKKPRVRTQVEEVMDAQLTEMAFSNQNAVAELQNEFEIGARGLASMDRINEAIENGKEMPLVNVGKNQGVSDTNFSKSEVLKINSFQEDISSILKNEKISLDEFNSMRMKGASELTNEQRRIMMKIREQVPNPQNDTILQKVIDGGKINNYIKEDNPWNTVGGFITKAQDAKALSTLQEVYHGLALGYKNTPFTVGVDKDYGIIRFKTDAVDKIDIPYGPTMEVVGAKPPIGGFDTSPDPFTGHGFTKDIYGNIIPEYTMQYLKPNEGAELYRVNSKTGIEELIGKYINDKFIKIK